MRIHTKLMYRYCLFISLFFFLWQSKANAQNPYQHLDVPYVATSQEVVDSMLSLAEVGKDDLVYDPGCGDGRILVTAAKKYGAKGVGIDLDPQRIKEAKENAQLSGVTEKTTFIEEDLFKVDYSKASVVTLYLLPYLNLRLLSKLLTELKPGSRIVSHAFDMGIWTPDKQLKVGETTIYLWTIPERK